MTRGRGKGTGIIGLLLAETHLAMGCALYTRPTCNCCNLQLSPCLPPPPAVGQHICLFRLHWSASKWLFNCICLRLRHRLPQAQKVSCIGLQHRLYRYRAADTDTDTYVCVSIDVRVCVCVRIYGTKRHMTSKRYDTHGNRLNDAIENVFKDRQGRQTQPVSCRYIETLGSAT